MAATVHEAGRVTPAITEELCAMYFGRCATLDARLRQALAERDAYAECLRASLAFSHALTLENNALRQLEREHANSFQRLDGPGDGTSAARTDRDDFAPTKRWSGTRGGQHRVKLHGGDYTW